MHHWLFELSYYKQNEIQNTFDSKFLHVTSITNTSRVMCYTYCQSSHISFVASLPNSHKLIAAISTSTGTIIDSDWVPKQYCPK